MHGETTFDYRGLAIKWEGVLTFLHVFINTTAIHQLAQSRAEVRCQRIMVASLTHELRTPLNSAQLALDIMDDYLDAEGKRYNRIAKNSCYFLNSLIEDILDYSRFESGVFELNCEYFVLGGLIDQMNELFE